jgi:hypothetical protein
MTLDMERTGLHFFDMERTGLDFFFFFFLRRNAYSMRKFPHGACKVTQEQKN